MGKKKAIAFVAHPQDGTGSSFLNDRQFNGSDTKARMNKSLVFCLSMALLTSFKLVAASAVLDSKSFESDLPNLRHCKSAFARQISKSGM
jgi:hypothetical protein